MGHGQMKKNLNDKKILVTYGPTWVAIDDMRVISNRSSGTLGKLMINELLNAGANITALEGPITDPLSNKKIRIKKFTFFDEFTKLFKNELQKKYDVVIHAAAISDFKPEKKCQTKISSDKRLRLTLIPTKKLITTIKRLAPKSFLVGFKLESAKSKGHLKKSAVNSIRINRCDLIVANSLTNGYNGFIFDKNGKLVGQGKSRQTISKQLIKLLCQVGPAGASHCDKLAPGASSLQNILD